ncbi:MAG: ROK family protein [Candidatus Hodarchaeota archaeon]
MKQLYGGVEIGGTKFICAVGTKPEDLKNIFRSVTTNPSNTISSISHYFYEQNKINPLTAIGIGTFGPIDNNRNSSSYGFITSTPKQYWQCTDILGSIKKALNLHVVFDLDTKTAALGEYLWGAAHGLQNFLYITVGSGIGGGAMFNGQFSNNPIPPEMGHIFIPHDKKLDPFNGVCPFHGDCLEGLASGPAMTKRWKIQPESLPPDHPAWELESVYLAYAITNYIYILSPQRIVLGGGVMKQTSLFPMIRKNVQSLINRYFASDIIIDRIDDYIVPSELGDLNGVIGAISLAKKEYP